MSAGRLNSNNIAADLAASLRARAAESKRGFCILRAALARYAAPASHNFRANAIYAQTALWENYARLP